MAALVRAPCDTSTVTANLNVETDSLQYYEHQSTSQYFNCKTEPSRELRRYVE